MRSTSTMSPSVLNLSACITVHHDEQSIVTSWGKCERVLETPWSELVRWLYEELHTGHHLNLVDPVTELKNGELRKAIIEVTDDKGMPIPKKSIQYIQGKTQVTLAGVRVSLGSDINDSDIDKLRIPYLRPFLTPGFVMYRCNPSPRLPNMPRRRFYVECDTTHFALSFWSRLLSELSKELVQFSAKILSQQDFYPRNDAIVIYTDDDDTSRAKVYDILSHINDDLRKDPPGIRHSCLVESLGSGLSTAMQPLLMPGENEKSFGEHRCEAIANAIRDSFTTYLPFQNLLEARMISARINPENLALNLS